MQEARHRTIGSKLGFWTTTYRALKLLCLFIGSLASCNFVVTYKVIHRASARAHPLSLRVAGGRSWPAFAMVAINCVASFSAGKRKAAVRKALFFWLGGVFCGKLCAFFMGTWWWGDLMVMGLLTIWCANWPVRDGRVWLKGNVWFGTQIGSFW